MRIRTFLTASASVGAIVAATTPALAQSLTTPPPTYRTLDDNGVDLASGQIVARRTSVSVGDPDGAGGALSRYIQTSFDAEEPRDNLTGAYNFIQESPASKFTVSVGDRTEEFGVASNLAVNPGNLGGRLEVVQGNPDYTSIYTAQDGTVAYFNGNLNNRYAPRNSGAALLTKLVRPDGETLTYYYRQDPNDADWIIRAVVSNLGYMIRYEYEGTTVPSNRRLTRVTAINLAYDYCDPTAASCSLSTPTVWSRKTMSHSGSFDTNYFFYETDGLNRTTSYTQTPGATGTLTMTTPAGVPIKYTYGFNTNFFGKVQTALTNESAVPWTYDYVTDGGGNERVTTATRTDPLNHTTTVHFDPNTHKVTSVTNPLGQTTTYNGGPTIDPAQLTDYVVTEPEGNSDVYHYDSRYNVTSRTLKAKPGSGLADKVTTYVYPTTCIEPRNCNKPTQVTENGATTDYEYNAHGQVTTVTAPAGVNGVRPQTRYTYQELQASYLDPATGSVVQGGPVSRLTQASTCMTGAPPSCLGTADEIRTTYTYYSGTAAEGANLRIQSVTVAAGDGSKSATTTYTYDKVGNLVTVDGPLSGPVDVAMNRYDVERQLVGQIDPDPDSPGLGKPSLARRFSYNPDSKPTTTERGNVVSLSDADWAAFTSPERDDVTYDNAGRKNLESTTNGATVQYSYNAHRLNCVAVRMNPAVYQSLPADACVQSTNGAQGPDRITQYSYDNADRVLVTTDGLTTSDQRNTETKTYSANGKVQTIADGKGNLTTYEYDGFDRLSKTRFPSASNGAQSSTTDYEQLTYDPLTWFVSQERRRDNTTNVYGYDQRGNRVSKSLPATTYSYDNLNRMLSAAAGGITLTDTYDALGRLVSSAQPLGTVTYDYDAAGRRIRMDWPGGYYVTYDYTNANALAAVREYGALSGTGVLATFTYGGMGRRLTLERGNGVTTSYQNSPGSLLLSLTHDAAGTANDVTLSFAYNAPKQIVSRTSNNANYTFSQASASKSYAVNGLNQLATVNGAGATYDQRGNLTSDGGTTYTYDTANRLTGTSAGGSAEYDPIDRLYQITSSGGAVTRFLYDGPNRIAEYDASNGLLRRYIHGPRADEPLVWLEGSGTSDRRWLLADNQGSIIATTDGLGLVTGIYRYDDYGVAQLPAGLASRFQYTGQTWVPEVSLYNYKVRFYAPHLGRFMQADPVGYSAGLNMYAYVDDDPVNNVDPTGTYERGTGWTNDEWRLFERAQRRAAAANERAAARLEKASAAVAAGGTPSKADKKTIAEFEKKTGAGNGTAANMQAAAQRYREGAAALRAGAGSGYIANAYNAKAWQALGRTPGALAAAAHNSTTMMVNVSHPWFSDPDKLAWSAGHEPFHGISGLHDQLINGHFAYKWDERGKYFNLLRQIDPARALENPDHLVDFAQ